MSVKYNKAKHNKNAKKNKTKCIDRFMKLSSFYGPVDKSFSVHSSIFDHWSLVPVYPLTCSSLGAITQQRKVTCLSFWSFYFIYGCSYLRDRIHLPLIAFVMFLKTWSEVTANIVQHFPVPQSLYFRLWVTGHLSEEA